MNKPTYDQHFFPHWTSVDVRYRDLDTLNHVNNATYSTYYEEARLSFIKAIPEIDDDLLNEYSFVVINIQIDFINPIELADDLLIGSGIKKHTHTSMTSFQAIYDKNTKELKSVAEATGVWFNIEKQKPAGLPAIENIDRLTVNL